MPETTSKTTADEAAPKAGEEEEVRPFVWLDVGHVQGSGNVGALPEDIRIQNGKVAVDAVTGLVLSDQPDYPEHDVPEPAPPEPAPPEPAPEAKAKDRDR
jgi:hypothetical protein